MSSHYLKPSRALLSSQTEVPMRSPSRMCRRWSVCPLCLAGDKGPYHQFRLNELHFAELERRRCEMALRRPVVTEPAAAIPVGARGGESGVLYPNLCEYLFSDCWEDGSPRRTSTLTVFGDGEGFKGSLNDRATDNVAFVSAATIEELLAVFEAKLTASSLDWRKNGGNGQGKKRGRS